MTIFELALKSIEACEAEGVDLMVTGAFATSVYGIPRSTQDVDFVIFAEPMNDLFKVIDRLSGEVEFGDQVQFDTLTRGIRHVGKTRSYPFYKVEFFELFDNPFVIEQFQRKVAVFMPSLGREVMVPRAEDVIVQKLRWARDKDLIDARDVIIVQGTDHLEMDYIRNWCQIHENEVRLEKILAEI